MKNKTKDLNTQRVDAYIFKKKKNSRFQKCPDACGRGLGYTLCFQQETESFAKTSGTVNGDRKKKKKKALFFCVFPSKTKRAWNARHRHACLPLYVNVLT